LVISWFRMVWRWCEISVRCWHYWMVRFGSRSRRGRSIMVGLFIRILLMMVMRMDKVTSSMVTNGLMMFNLFWQWQVLQLLHHAWHLRVVKAHGINLV
jgi:hypothetical protein